MGDKWSLLIVRDIMMGKSRFNEFLSSPEKVTTNILADRLKRLEACGVISRAPYQEHPTRYAYALTDKGHALEPILHEVIAWASDWEPDTEEPPSRLRPQPDETIRLEAQSGRDGCACKSSA